MRRAARVLGLLLVALAMLAYAEVRAFIAPVSDPPDRVDAVLVVGPIYGNDQLQVAQAYVREHPGPVVLVSVDDPVNNCRGMTVPGAAALQCFRPDPFTTQGEARFAGEYMTSHRLWSVLVVAPPDQLVRAKLRMARCTGGPVTGVASHRDRDEVLSLLGYQNAAMLQAQVLKRGC